MSTTVDACSYNNNINEYSTGYHIGAVFVILTASVLGTSIPIVSAYFTVMQQYQFLYVCGKHIGMFHCYGFINIYSNMII